MAFLVTGVTFLVSPKFLIEGVLCPTTLLSK
jgi:hypothetical protein